MNFFAISYDILVWNEARIVFFLIFLNFFPFFWNFLLRVKLEWNMTIVFIFSLSQRLPPYFGLKWSHNSILQFFEFFCYLFGIFYYVSAWNEATMVFLYFRNCFSIFSEFSFTRRVGTKLNDNCCFPSLSAFFNVFWLEMKPQWHFFKFFKFFPIFSEFSITRQVGMEHDDSFYFFPFSAFPPLFWLEMKP